MVAPAPAGSRADAGPSSPSISSLSRSQLAELEAIKQSAAGSLEPALVSTFLSDFGDFVAGIPAAAAVFDMTEAEWARVHCDPWWRDANLLLA